MEEYQKRILDEATGHQIHTLLVWLSLPARFKYAFCSLTQNVCIFHVFGYLRMGGPHKIVEFISKLEDFDEIDRLMHSTEAAVSGDCCSILKLDFNIPNLVLLLVKATVDRLKPFLHLFKPSIHLLLDLLEAFIHLLLHFAKLRCNKPTLTKKFFSHSLVVGIQRPAQDRKTPIDIFERWIVFGRWGSSGILGQLAHHDRTMFEFVIHV